MIWKAPGTLNFRFDRPNSWGKVIKIRKLTIHMRTTELKVRLPAEEADFLETYARDHATTVDEILARYARRLQSASARAPHADNLRFTGVVPADVDAREIHREHIVDKP